MDGRNTFGNDLERPEVLGEVFRFLSPAELATMARVSSFWRDIATHSGLWKEHCERQWGSINKQEKENWNQHYVARLKNYNRYRESIETGVEEFRSSLANPDVWRFYATKTYQGGNGEPRDLTIQTMSSICPRTKKRIFGMRVSSIVTVPSNALLDILMDLSIRKKWDKNTICATVLDRLDRQTDMIQTAYRNIELITLRSCIEFPETQTTWMITSSCVDALLSKSRASTPSPASSQEAPQSAPPQTSNQPSNQAPNQQQPSNQPPNQQQPSNQPPNQQPGGTRIDLVKRGSGFSIRTIDVTSSDVSYVLQFEEGEWIDDSSLMWMCEARWNTIPILEEFYHQEWLPKQRDDAKRRKKT
eukprot:TRINITY_DN4782_c0_g1_i1.p1 TRINITY_DN4782_c0_g1~~TRINITY_DN4782_c0_g1_i1.p1  ORF type:complete len:359 (+),score=48.59 TRINITY_DN4782_c0_g1_i1:73-1149(+)